jgi:hypothetical protein
MTTLKKNTPIGKEKKMHFFNKDYTVYVRC